MIKFCVILTIGLNVMFYIENISNQQKIFQLSWEKFKNFLCKSDKNEQKKLMNTLELIKENSGINFVFANLNGGKNIHKLHLDFQSLLIYYCSKYLLANYKISLHEPCKHIICISFDDKILLIDDFQLEYKNFNLYMANKFIHLFPSSSDELLAFSGKFGMKFETIMANILNDDNQYINNQLISHFNRYFKSKKNSECVVLSNNFKTDIVYQNKNRTLNEISIKTTMRSDYYLNFGSSSISNCYSLYDIVALFSSNFDKFFEHFFHKKYSEHINTPYLRKKHDNIKFLMFYDYKMNNINDASIKGDLNVIPMKVIENLLMKAKLDYHLSFHVKKTSLKIKYYGETIFEIVQTHKNKTNSCNFSLSWMANKNSTFFRHITSTNGFLNTTLEIKNPFV